MRERCLVRGAHLEFFLRHENILRCEWKNARRKYFNNDFSRANFIPSSFDVVAQNQRYFMDSKKCMEDIVAKALEFSINRNAQQ